MDDYNDNNVDDNGIYKDEDGDEDIEDDDDSNITNVNTDSEQDHGNYDRTQDEETISNNTLGEYDWKSISNNDTGI